MDFFRKILGSFLLVEGISIIVIWGMLIFSGELQQAGQQLFSFVFHWLSELLLAAFGIYTGINLLKNKHRVLRIAFFVLGLSVCSTYLASGYYLFKVPDYAMAGVIGFFFVLSLLFALLSFRYLKIQQPIRSFEYKFGLLGLGLAVYLLINLCGEYGQNGEWLVFVLMLFLLLSACFFTYIFTFKRTVRIRSS